MLRLTTTVLAGEAEATMNQANEYYKVSKYKEAIELYERLANSGIQAAELYYNLGNAYYKSGNIPAAILNLERAKRLDPNDEDIDFNLTMAQAKIIDKIDPAPKFFLVTWWQFIVGLASADEWAITGVASMWILFIAAGAFFIATTSTLKKILFAVGVSSLLVTCVMMVFAVRQYRQMHSDKVAIIFAPTIAVKSAPQEDSKDLFVLHEGSKVEILEVMGEWYKVRIADGSVGWMRANTMQVI
jgi:tetratricopeptide (TPR) repeat protein